MESITILAVWLKRNVILETLGRMEPFLNIKEQDGIIYYRIIIILKMLFALHKMEANLPNYLAQIYFAISNIFIAFKYKEMAAISAAIQGLFIVAPSKKFALFLNMACMGIFAMNIEPYEFFLDLGVSFCLMWYAIEAYRTEIQKLCTIISLGISMGWCACNLSKLSLTRFFQIAGCLMLAYAPLRPNMHNKHRNKFLYFYTIMFIWIAYKFQPILNAEVQTFNLETNSISQMNERWEPEELFDVNIEKADKTALVESIKNSEPPSNILAEESLMNNIDSLNKLTNGAFKSEDDTKNACPFNSFSLHAELRENAARSLGLEQNVLKSASKYSVSANQKCDICEALKDETNCIEGKREDLKQPNEVLQKTSGDSLMNLASKSKRQEKECYPKEDSQADADINFHKKEPLKQTRTSEEGKSKSTDEIGRFKSEGNNELADNGQKCYDKGNYSAIKDKDSFKQKKKTDEEYTELNYESKFDSFDESFKRGKKYQKQADEDITISDENNPSKTFKEKVNLETTRNTFTLNVKPASTERAKYSKATDTLRSLKSTSLKTKLFDEASQDVSKQYERELLKHIDAITVTGNEDVEQKGKTAELKTNGGEKEDEDEWCLEELEVMKPATDETLGITEHEGTEHANFKSAGRDDVHLSENHEIRYSYLLAPFKTVHNTKIVAIRIEKQILKEVNGEYIVIDTEYSYIF